MSGEVQLFCQNCSEGMAIIDEVWTDKIVAWLKRHVGLDHRVITQVFADGRWNEVISSDYLLGLVFNSSAIMFNELPERLKGIICMIENKQLSLAIDHLLKLIKEVDAMHFGVEVK